MDDRLRKIRDARLTPAEVNALVVVDQAGSVRAAADYLRITKAALKSARNRAFRKLNGVGAPAPDLRRAGERGAIGRCRRGLLQGV